MKKRKWHTAGAVLIGICMAIVILLVLFPAGNTESTETVQEVTEGSRLTADRIKNTDDWKTHGLESAGLGGIEISEPYECSFGNLYVLVDKEEAYRLTDIFFALEREETVFLCEVDKCAVMESLYLYDVDGEEGEEIIYTDNTGGNGGAGSHTAMVFKVTDYGLSCIFSKDRVNEFENGFESELVYPFGIKLTNSITGFETVIDCSDVKDYYIGDYYDEQGNPLGAGGLGIDCIFSFEPTDVDGDGVYELVCRQYTYMGFTAGAMGEAVTTIQYNPESKSFDVIDADFEPYDR